jgi:hypothetical protein
VANAVDPGNLLTPALVMALIEDGVIQVAK